MITIVILIILATITVNFLFGENGVITMAQKAKDLYENAQKDEEQQLAGIFGKNFADYNGQLHVEDGKLVNQYNEQMQLKGFVGSQLNQYSNHFDGTTTFKYYLNSESIKNLKSWGTNIIRIGLEIDQVRDTKIMQDYLDTIDLLIENDIYVLALLWNNGNINENVDIAKEYFEIISQRYSNTPNILYEIANEPDSSIEWSEIRDYSNTIIPIIRNYRNDSIIIVPCASPEWIGRPNEVNLNELVETNNIMISYHMYVGEQLTATRIGYLQDAINKKMPIFITEWGTTLASGNDGFYENYSNCWMKFMDDNKLSWCNFYITDVNFRVDQGLGEPEYAGIVQHNKWNNSLSDDILTASGRYIKNILQGTCNSYNSGSFAIMMERDNNKAFWLDEYREKITKVEFKNEQDIPKNALISWDISFLNEDKVFAYILETEDTYELYITSSITIYLPIDSGFMFQDFLRLKTIIFNNISTLNCNNLSHFFTRCSNLETINGISDWNTSHVRYLYDVFFNCESLKELNLSGWDTSNVEGMINMFSNCRNLTRIIGISDWNVSNVRSINSMFLGCNSLIELDLKNWNLKNVNDSSYCFFNMINLENLYLNNVEFNFEILTSYSRNDRCGN